MLRIFRENENNFFKSSVCETCSCIKEHLKHLIDIHGFDERKETDDKRQKKEIDDDEPEEKNLSNIISPPLPHSILLSESIDTKEEAKNICVTIGSDKLTTPPASPASTVNIKKKPLRPSMISAGEEMLNAVGDIQMEEEKRLAVAKMEPFEVKTKYNIATAAFGKENGEAILDFTLYNKKTGPVGNITMFSFFCLGNILGALSLFNIISPEIGAIGVLFTFPTMIFQNILALITDLLLILLRKYDTWYMIYNTIGACAGLCLLLQDLRMFYVIISCVSVSISSFYDALPEKLRRINQINGAGFAIILLCVFQVGLYCNWFQVQHVEYNLGAIRFTASGFAATCIFNITVYLFKNFISALVHPERLVLIKAPVVTEKLSGLEAKIVITAYNIKEIREALEETKNN